MGVLSGYRIMWMLVMFDLPVLTPAERKEATNFRVFLLHLGFERSQFSVYMRCCPGKEKVEQYVRRIRDQLPEGGKVDILTFTDRQYENIISFRSQARRPKKKSRQLTLF